MNYRLTKTVKLMGHYGSDFMNSELLLILCTTMRKTNLSSFISKIQKKFIPPNSSSKRGVQYIKFLVNILVYDFMQF